MGKGDRPKKIRLPKLAPVPRPKKRGRARMEEIDAATKVHQNETLIVRAKRLGLPPTVDVLNAMKAPHLSCEAGFAIHIGAESAEERREVWGLVTEWRKKESRFLGHCVGRKVYSGRDSIPHIPEPLQTRDDMEIDLRTSEEKADAARKGWNAWCEDTSILNRAQSAIVWDAVWEVTEGRLVKDSCVVDGIVRPARLTADGAAFMRSMRLLAQHVDMNGGTP